MCVCVLIDQMIKITERIRVKLSRKKINLEKNVVEIFVRTWDLWNNFPTEAGKS